MPTAGQGRTQGGNGMKSTVLARRHGLPGRRLVAGARGDGICRTGTRADQRRRIRSGAGDERRQRPVIQIVVVGVRGALATSQTIKKNADTVLDSITATDIGAFPDKSTPKRSSGCRASPSTASAPRRHLPFGPSHQASCARPAQVRNEFNGRDTFCADSARGLGWADVSPELMAGVDAYKNATADLTEGGIAGTVDLRTRLPFDQPGLVAHRQCQRELWRPVEEVDARSLGADQRSLGHRHRQLRAARRLCLLHVITRTESVVIDKIDTYCSSATPISNGVDRMPRGIRSAAPAGPMTPTASAIRRSITTASATVRRPPV